MFHGPELSRSHLAEAIIESVKETAERIVSTPGKMIEAIRKDEEEARRQQEADDNPDDAED